MTAASSDGPPLHHHKGQLCAPSPLEGAVDAGDGGWGVSTLCTPAGTLHTPWAAQHLGMALHSVSSAGVIDVIQ